MGKKKVETEQVQEAVIEATPVIEEVKVTPEMMEQLSCGAQEMLSYGVGEALFLSELASRIFYLDTVITPDTFREVTMFIVKANIQDAGLPIEERLPIKLVINSPGGSVLDGLGLLDVIKTSQTPVFSIVIGYACSMAFFIAATSHVRFATPNAVFLNHDGETGLIDSTMKFRDAVNFYDKLDKRLDRMVAAKTKLTVKELEDTKRIEQYWFADEAKDAGIVDYIIGEDISYQDIFCFESECDCDDCCCES